MSAIRRFEMGYDRSEVTGGVLAGGRGRRMGGCDKGLVTVGGRPMVEYVLSLLRPQVGSLLINANRNRARYAAFGYPVVADERPDYAGPLAGIASIMAAAKTPRVLVVPCDGPRLPDDLAPRLKLSLAGADIAAAHDGIRLQPLFALLKVGLVTDLRWYLDTGGRGVEPWFARHRVAEVDFSDAPGAFLNLNRPAQRVAMNFSVSR